MFGGVMVQEYPEVAFVVAATVVITLLHRLNLYWRLRKFNGPFSGKFSEFWLFKHTVAGDLHEKSAEILVQYGGPELIARIGPNLLTTGNTAFWKSINDDRAWVKGSWYPAMQLEPGKDSVFSETDGARHDLLKQKLTRGYSAKDNVNFESEIEDIIRNLFQYIDNNPVFELSNAAQFFTLDVLTKLAFGKSFGCLPSGTDMYDYIKTSHEFMPILELKANHRWIDAITKTAFFQMLVAPTVKDKTGMGKVMGIAKDIVAERFAMKEKYDTIQNGRDMLGSFMEKGLTQEEAYAESLLQIMAGTDSTATTLRITLFYTMTSPRVWRKLQDIITAEAEKHPDKVFIPDSALKNVPYLQAVIKEGLRMFPPLTGTRVKVAPPHGWTVPGTDLHIPGGTEVGQCVWALRQDKATYGEDAHVFRPERWLESGKEQLEAMEDSVQTLFGNGRHRCLGKTVALIELNKCIAEVVRSYDLAIVDPITPFKTRCNGIHLTSGMNVLAVRRRHT